MKINWFNAIVIILIAIALLLAVAQTTFWGWRKKMKPGQIVLWRPNLNESYRVTIIAVNKTECIITAGKQDLKVTVKSNELFPIQKKSLAKKS